MLDGEYTIYVLQWQLERESKEWGNPDSSFEWAKGHYAEGWFDCGPDSWAEAVDPSTCGKDGGPRYKSPRAHDDLDYTFRHAGRHGWHDIKYALKALKRARQLDDQGAWDTFDPGFHKKHMQRVRHKFQVVKVRMVQYTRLITENEVLEAV